MQMDKLKVAGKAFSYQHKTPVKKPNFLSLQFHR